MPTWEKASEAEKLVSDKLLKLQQFIPLERNEVGNYMFEEENPYNLKKLNELRT